MQSPRRIRAQDAHGFARDQEKGKREIGGALKSEYKHTVFRDLTNLADFCPGKVF
jgi:hypothetical protein